MERTKYPLNHEWHVAVNRHSDELGEGFLLHVGDMMFWDKGVLRHLAKLRHFAKRRGLTPEITGAQASG